MDSCRLVPGRLPRQTVFAVRLCRQLLSTRLSVFVRRAAISPRCLHLSISKVHLSRCRFVVPQLSPPTNINNQRRKTRGRCDHKEKNGSMYRHKQGLDSARRLLDKSSREMYRTRVQHCTLYSSARYLDHHRLDWYRTIQDSRTCARVRCDVSFPMLNLFAHENVKSRLKPIPSFPIFPAHSALFPLFLPPLLLILLLLLDL